MKDTIVPSVVRTPVGKLLGAFKNVSATDLGVVAAKEAMRRAGVREEEIQEVIVGVTNSSRSRDWRICESGSGGGKGH
jgi:acetyl-CoA C-acetyltransferase